MPENREEQGGSQGIERSSEQIRWRPSRDEIQEILNRHHAWLDSRGKEGDRVELYFADLNDSDLHLANLKGACLFDTTLYRTDLRDADLTETEGVIPKNLAGANLTGAKLDDKVASFPGLKTVESASRYARKIFFVILLVMVYVWLSLASVNDATLLSNLDTLKLPYAGVEIPASIFFGGVPIILLMMFVYFHLMQQRVWESISELPAIFPDGTPIHKKIYPWLLNGIAAAHVPFVRKKRQFFSRFQNFISILVAWWFIPYTMLWFWIKYLTKREWLISGIHIGAVSLSIGFAFFFLFLTRRTLRGDSLKGHGIFLRLFLYLIVLAVFLGASYGIIEYQPERAENQPLGFVVSIAEKFGFDTNVDFSYNDVSIKPSGWTGDPSQLDEVRGAQLAGMNLPEARAVNAFMALADLSDADLSHAVLDSADLRHANLTGADLSGASLVSADLENAIMTGVNIKGANLKGTDLRNVTGLSPGVLYSAENWLEAKFAGDILDSLGLPADHNERIARRDLSGADLSGADFRNLSLAGFNLSGTDLRQADLTGTVLDSANLFLTDLRGTKGIDLTSVKRSKNWLFALYNDELIGALGLPENHNELASKRDFRSYDLKGINLSDVDLSGANLRKVDLTGAVLHRVNLQDADLYAVKLNQADLTGADFKGTILLDTDLRGANLTGVKNLTMDQLRWAALDTTTVVPEALREQVSTLLERRNNR